MISHADSHDPLDMMHDCEVCATAVRVALNNLGHLVLGPKDADKLITTLRLEARGWLERSYD